MTQRTVHDHAPARGRHPCVRCGRHDAAPDLFICAGCEADPDRVREQRYVEEHVSEHKLQRRTLVLTFGWRGGWWHI